jgi:hypothetical protein
MKTKEDIFRLVQTELQGIRKRDGELGPTPYVVLEIIDRLKTVNEWQDRDHTRSVAFGIRELVELAIKNPKAKLPAKPVAIKSIYEDAESFGDDFDIHPELEVDWNKSKSVEKYSNTILSTSKKNLVKSARREKKFKKTG